MTIEVIATWNPQEDLTAWDVAGVAVHYGDGPDAGGIEFWPTSLDGAFARATPIVFNHDDVQTIGRDGAEARVWRGPGGIACAVRLPARVRLRVMDGTLPLNGFSLRVHGATIGLARRGHEVVVAATGGSVRHIALCAGRYVAKGGARTWSDHVHPGNARDVAARIDRSIGEWHACSPLRPLGSPRASRHGGQ